MSESEGDKLTQLKERIKKLAEKRKTEILVKKEEPVEENQKSHRSQRSENVHIVDDVVEIEDSLS